MDYWNAREPASADAQPEAPQPQQAHVFGDFDVQKLISEAGRHWDVLKASGETKD